ncbi:MAG: TetR/AcrR family transcriptional regulator [Pseudomonadota bacterium]
MPTKTKKTTSPPRRETSLRKLPSQARSRERYERMLSAAAELLNEQGYDQLKTVTIAERAGVPVGTVYQFFPNKHSILTVLVERWLELDNVALATIEARRDQYNSVVDEFIDLAKVWVDDYKANRNLLALVPLIPNIPELFEMTEAHDKAYAKRLTLIMDRHSLKADAATKMALAGYYTIIVDAAGISIATETPKRAKLKSRFLFDSVHDLFSRYI